MNINFKFKKSYTGNRNKSFKNSKNYNTNHKTYFICLSGCGKVG